MLGVMYDLHGNLPALEAVLEDAQAAGVDRFAAEPQDGEERLLAGVRNRIIVFGQKGSG